MIFSRSSSKVNITVLKEIVRTLISTLSFFLVVLIMTLSQIITDKQYKSHINAQKVNENPLFDVFFGIIPRLSTDRYADISLNSSIIIALLGTYFSLDNWRSRLVVLRRCFWISASIYLLRTLTIRVTILPPTLGSECLMLHFGDNSISRNNNYSPLVDVIRDYFDSVMILLSGSTKSCTDNIFSGHASISIVVFLMWWMYSKSKLLLAYSAIHTLVTLYLIMATRLHYSVDVILAIAITIGVHFFYFYQLEKQYVCLLAEKSRKNTIFFYQEPDSDNYFNLREIESCIDINNGSTTSADFSTPETITLISNNQSSMDTNADSNNEINDNIEFTSSETLPTHTFKPTNQSYFRENINKSQNYQNFSKCAAISDSRVFYIQRHLSLSFFRKAISWADGLDLRIDEL
ncbi:Phosphatidylcholine:ceramide cholinephosphotransferase 1 [Smittium culicis]|uniref:Phosphatidylcholine:ceramide cholinephosphotransferase 1 n=1 Tax=Smittium culicis TaxID=133412 RepID=A0A1R1YT07_9FUNG|nr:Phosphatidylcholine:ceramide cholinephosphotransferase 1 [Smittium culicis]